MLVNTTAGQHLIAGDALPLYDNFESRTFRMSGLCHSMDDYYATFDKIKSIHPAAIIPGHEPRVEKIKVFPEV